MKHLLLFILCMLLLPVKAEVLSMHTGDRVSGQIVSQDDTEVTINTSFAGQLTIKRNLIAKMEQEPAQKKAVPQKKASTKPKPLKLAASPSSALPRDWNAKIDLATNVSRGTRESHLASLQVAWQKHYDKHLFKADLTAMREVDEGLTVKEQDLLDLGYQYSVTDKWFFALNAKLARIPTSFIDQRYSIHPAIGRTIFSDERKTLNIQLDIGYSQENTVSGDTGSELVGFRVDYKYTFPNGSLVAFHKNHIYRNLSGFENTVATSQTGIQYALSKAIHFNMQVNYDYNSKPVDSAEKAEITLLIGAGVSL